MSASSDVADYHPSDVVTIDTELLPSMKHVQDRHVQLEAAVHFLGSVVSAAASNNLRQSQEGQSEQGGKVSAGLKQLLNQVLAPTFQQPRLLALQVKFVHCSAPS